jgi:D-inositol-3-phosphate glycosyltransferase
MPVPRRFPRRIATVSVHTSPLEQPGTGDAGGLNVYVVEVARRLAARGVEVDIFTRAVSREQPPVAELAPGVLVRHLTAGPFEDLDKSDLPGQLCQFTFELLRAEASFAPGRYDLIHGHYWLSGQVGAVAKERWGVPLVQSMHTLGKVKNAALAAGDASEPAVRLRGEAEVIATADRLIANTDDEASQLISGYSADPARVSVVNPGVSLSVFRPGSQRQARQQLGLPPDGIVLVFAGRVQPLKAPDVVLHAAARMIADDPSLASRLTIAFVGGPSGSGRADPDGLTELAGRLGLAGLVRLEPPCPQPELATWYRAASIVMVPSYSESFGLVAVEAQACGTPVVAAAVGGLRTAVRHGVSGILVDSRDPASYAQAIRELIAAPQTLARLSRGARQHASRFGWSVTVDGLMELYSGAMSESAGAVSVGAVSVGAVSVGAVSVGAVSVGAVPAGVVSAGAVPAGVAGAVSAGAVDAAAREA